MKRAARPSPIASARTCVNPALPGAFAALIAVAACGGSRADTGPTTPPSAGGQAASPTVDENPASPIPWSESGVDWTRPPAPGPEPAFEIPAASSFELANGLDVYVVENPSMPLVTLQLANRAAGALYEPPRLAGLASLTADMLDEGAGSRPALELAAELERLGATLSTSADNDAAYVTVTTLASNLDPTLALLTDVLRDPRLTVPDVRRIKGDRLSKLKQRKDNANAVATQFFREALYGRSGAYGTPSDGYAETLARIKPSDVKNFYVRHYGPDRMVLVVSGAVTARDLRARLGKTLGSWRRKARPGQAADVTAVEAPPRLVIAHKPGSAQSVIRLGRVTLERKDPRYFVAEVLNGVLGGSFSARFNNVLREQLGYTYGARSRFEFGRYDSPWALATSIFTAKTIPALERTRAIVGAIIDTPVPAEELDRVKRRLVRALPQSFSSNRGIAASYLDLIEHELPLDWYDNYAERIEDVSAADVQALASELLAEDQLTLVVVGDLELLREPLLDLGLRPAVEVDLDGKLVQAYDD